ncbi:hypothetical protein B0H14DRAFT_2309282, partial [Mycena olivaceomarginata]
PQELVDIVVNNLQDDTPSLKACSLTAHTFVPSARIHIFKRIEIMPPNDNPGSKEPPSRSPCQKLLKMLNSSPHIAPFVEELSIV